VWMQRRLTHTYRERKGETERESERKQPYTNHTMNNETNKKKKIHTCRGDGTAESVQSFESGEDRTRKDRRGADDLLQVQRQQ
jgi:hypothetical protein